VTKRLKQRKPAPEKTAVSTNAVSAQTPEPVRPEYDRATQWGEFAAGDQVRLRGGRKGSEWVLVELVTPRDGRSPYVSLLEQQSANRQRPGPRIIRSVRPEDIVALPKKRAKVSQT